MPKKVLQSISSNQALEQMGLIIKTLSPVLALMHFARRAPLNNIKELLCCQ